jgi:hypothetical protein
MRELSGSPKWSEEMYSMDRQKSFGQHRRAMNGLVQVAAIGIVGYFRSVAPVVVEKRALRVGIEAAFVEFSNEFNINSMSDRELHGIIRLAALRVRSEYMRDPDLDVAVHLRNELVKFGSTCRVRNIRPRIRHAVIS